MNHLDPQLHFNITMLTLQSLFVNKAITSVLWNVDSRTVFLANV